MGSKSNLRCIYPSSLQCIPLVLTYRKVNIPLFQETFILEPLKIWN